MPKILFICGSLEPSKDGVGDYVWELATNLQKSGFTCSCVSIHDKFVTPTIGFIETNNIPSEISRYRISHSTSWREKIKKLNIITDTEKPTFVSFHYVPYAYSSRGVPFRLVNWLPKLNYKCHWHLMLHELWVDPSLKAKNKLLSPVQRLLLKILVYRISPSVINTTNTYYENQLRYIGIQSKILPIFSNIKYITALPINHDATTWRFIFFGSIHPEWEHEYLLDAIDVARIKSNISVCSFTLIGHAGSYGVKLWSRLAADHRSNFIFQNLGELPVKEVSEQMQHANFGVTTTPSHLVEKSGAVAAMLAHGLPIIVPRVTKHLPDFNRTLEDTSSFILFKKGHVLQLETSMRHDLVDQLQSSTNQFIASLLSEK